MRERREFSRVEYHVEMECSNLILPNGDNIHLDQPARMVMLDLSIGGIGIVSDAAFKQDSILTFTLYLQRVPHTIMTRVKWATVKGEMYQYGLEFIGTPNQLFRQLKKIIKDQQALFVESV